MATFNHLQNFVPSWRLKRGLITPKQCDTIVTVPNVGCLLCFVNIVNAITKKLGSQLHQQYNKFSSCVCLVMLSFYKLFTKCYFQILTLMVYIIKFYVPCQQGPSWLAKASLTQSFLGRKFPVVEIFSEFWPLIFRLKSVSFICSELTEHLIFCFL